MYRITPDGKATIIFEPAELQVQTLEVAPGGVIYAATAPDGKVYKIEHKPAGKGEAKAESKSADKDAAKDAAKPELDPSWSSSVYFAPGTKYIWDLLLDKAGNLYVATGDHGEIYKVTAKGEHSLFFKSDETHIRVLAFDAQGNVIAGTDGSGLVYRISPAGEAFVLYSAPKKEITALTLDREGNIYAAGVGEKKSGGGSVLGRRCCGDDHNGSEPAGSDRAAGSRDYDHANCGHAIDGAISISGRRVERRVGCISHCAGRIALAHLDFARGHCVCAGLRFA